MITISDDNTITVTVPLRVRRRGGRKIIVAPNTAAAPTAPSALDDVLLKALVRAHRWRRMLESDQFASVAELAASEKVNHSYVCRLLRLNLLAPDIIQGILDGTQNPDLELKDLSKPFSVEWGAQRKVFGHVARR
jgi:hypothetical protein